jgi:hypothetical protein
MSEKVRRYNYVFGDADVRNTGGATGVGGPAAPTGPRRQGVFVWRPTTVRR